ncbi:MAG: DUF5110 domain-containing protein [Acetobacter sp.]|nr:DUF5110 domain-containing protein [Acetobacter sp.]
MTFRATILVTAAFSLLSPLLCYAAPRVAPAQAVPHAAAGATVTWGHARFTVLTSRLIRMEWSADSHFEDRATLVFLNRHLPVPHFTKTSDANGITLETQDLTLTYHPDEQGQFTDKTLQITLKGGPTPVTWHAGQKDTANLLGTTRTLDGSSGSHLKSPMEDGLVSRSGWSVVDDSQSPVFSVSPKPVVRKTVVDGAWVEERTTAPHQDLYFFGYGHNYRQALTDYCAVAGRIPLPPRYAFGVWWSRYWSYTDQDLLSLVQQFHENSLPLDVMVVDMDWHLNEDQLKKRGLKDLSGHRLGWDGYTWNSTFFPNPTAFMAQLHAQGIKVALNLHPASGVQSWESAFPDMVKTMNMPENTQYVPFLITQKNYAQAYFSVLHHPLEKQGVDFWWLDWQQEKTTPIAGLNPTWWLNYLHFTDQERQGKRPLVFHRWGGLGNHRYQIGFSGDTISTWESLAFQPWFTATAANVGYAYWSHDIGGHSPGAIDPELYTRWVQYGVFSPIFRTHTTKNPEAERRIWAYPEPYSDILRASFRLRAELKPYLYTEARKTYDTGIAFNRPLYYDWPEENDAYTMPNEYIFGDNMVVAPIVQPVDPKTGLVQATLWVPPGQWVERSSGKTYTGPTKITQYFSLHQTPMLIKAGAIMPLEEAVSGQSAEPQRVIEIWPTSQKEKTSYNIYEDNGQGVEYQKGAYGFITVSAQQTNTEKRVEIAPLSGHFKGMPALRHYALRFPAAMPPARILVNGHVLAPTPFAGQVGWYYEGNSLTTHVVLPPHAAHTPLSVVLVYDANHPAQVPTQGFTGRLTRLLEAYHALAPFERMQQAPDELVRAAQTGSRLGYAPETAKAELETFSAQAALAEQVVKADAVQLQAAVQAEKKSLFFGQKHKTLEQKQKIKDTLLQAIDQALTLVHDAQ